MYANAVCAALFTVQQLEGSKTMETTSAYASEFFRAFKRGFADGLLLGWGLIFVGVLVIALWV